MHGKQQTIPNYCINSKRNEPLTSVGSLNEILTLFKFKTKQT